MVSRVPLTTYGTSASSPPPTSPVPPLSPIARDLLPCTVPSTPEQDSRPIAHHQASRRGHPKAIEVLSR
ncbi:hypothetical protein TIFTF001_001616 [Ficus carica]|uniref:Uncharacterized protein n=1 Tax=Ficus carica TaxID=3494 RepID=A0AA87Z7J1_FICCA|nr:hypothetical protein TIFTF001_001616 [Ficus carica]